MKKRQIVLFCIVSICLLLWWIVQFYGDKKGREEIAIEVGQETFVATFDTVSSIVMCNQQASMTEELENDGAAFTIVISDQKSPESNQDQIILETANMKVHTNGYTSMESCTFSGLPFHLNEGSVYRVQYYGVTPSGKTTDDISIILYGKEYSSNYLTFFLFVLADIGIGVWIFTGNFFLPFICLLLLNTFLIPSLQSESETSAYADVYSASNIILTGIDNASNNGVLIEEAGIRNDGYTSYRVPMLRFWHDHQYGNNRENTSESINYRTSGCGINLFQIPAVIAVTLSRYQHLSYQIVRLAGCIINALLAVVILFLRMRTSSNTVNLWRYWKALMLLPSVQISILSYTGYGLSIVCISLLLFTLLDYYLSDKKIFKRMHWIFGTSIFLIVYEVIYAGYYIMQKNTLSTEYLYYILKCLMQKWDEYLNEFVVYEYYGYESLFIFVYILIGGILFFRKLVSIEISGKLSEKNCKLFRATYFYALKFIIFVVCTFGATLIGGIAYLPIAMIFLSQPIYDKLRIVGLKESSFKIIECAMLLASYAVVLTRFAAL